MEGPNLTVVITDRTSGTVNKARLAVRPFSFVASRTRQRRVGRSWHCGKE